MNPRRLLSFVILDVRIPTMLSEPIRSIECRMARSQCLKFKIIRLELTQRDYESVLFGETALPVTFFFTLEPITCQRDQLLPLCK